MIHKRTIKIILSLTNIFFLINPSPIKSQVDCSKPFISYAEKHGLSAPHECEIQPQYYYGDLALRKYICAHLRYPKEAKKRRIEGVVKVRFLVKKDGSIGDIHILQSPSKLLSKAITTVIRYMPRWEPGKDYLGNPIDEYYNIEYWFCCDKFQSLRHRLWHNKYANDDVYIPCLK